MKFRSALLLGGVVLITAIPVCADSIFYSASANEPSQPESSAPTVRASHTKFITPATARYISEPLSASNPAWTFVVPELGVAQDSTQRAISRNQTGTFALALDDPQNDARPSDPTPAMLSAGAFGGSGSESSMVLSTLVPAESKPSVHSANPAEFNSSDQASSIFSNEGSRFGFFGNDPDRGRIGKGKNKNNDQDGPPVNVPEPGALPLLTLGLLAVSIIAKRSHDFPTNA
jgi:hypothetical protein